MRVHEVDCKSGVGAALCENLNVVVSYAVNVGGTAAREGKGEGFHEGHLAGARHGLFVVVVAEYTDVWDLALDEDGYDFENGLGMGLDL